MQPACGGLTARGWDTSMLHSNTERLIDYWRQRKRGDLCPARHAIDPGELSLLLPQVFILGRTAPGRCVFRLAGGLVTDIHGRDMRHVDVLSLWTEAMRRRCLLVERGGCPQ